jgi:hypothetical protein
LLNLGGKTDEFGKSLLKTITNSTSTSASTFTPSTPLPTLIHIVPFAQNLTPLPPALHINSLPDLPLQPPRLSTDELNATISMKNTDKDPKLTKIDKLQSSSPSTTTTTELSTDQTMNHDLATTTWHSTTMPKKVEDATTEHSLPPITTTKLTLTPQLSTTSTITTTNHLIRTGPILLQ